MSAKVERARFLDNLGALATPATISEPLEGWLLRASPDVPAFRRPNSVLTLGRVTDVEAAIDKGEAFCAEHGVPPAFMVSDGSLPEDLDDRLARRGYGSEADVDVLTADLAAIEGGRSAVAVDTGLGIEESWIDEYASRFADEAVPAARIAGYARLLRRVDGEVVTAEASLHGRVAAVGFGVVEEGWMGVFGMGTAPESRRQGFATPIIVALARRATELGATHSYLQVECDNDPAQSVYRGLGYERSHGYHYRRSH